MYKIALINMPFANLELASIALTQLKSVLETRFKDQISVDVIYMNHDFGKFLGLEFYEFLTKSSESQNAGLGDWFFRQVAFPTLPNNAGPYLARYFPLRTEESNKIKRQILESRSKLGAFIDSLVSRYKLDQCDLVGFTSMFMQNVPSMALATKIKERNPKVIAIMGGANCESPMGQVIAKHAEQIDFVFSGPGLLSLPDFIQHCLNQEMEKCHSIKGVFSRRNYLFQSGPDAIGAELNIDVPIELDYAPFLRAVAESFPDGQVRPILSFETSRGCWWGERAHCTFCGLNGMSMAYRAMNSELAIQQFRSLFEYFPTVSRFEAVDNILPKNYFKDVLPYVDTPADASIFYEVKADLSESDVEALMKARVKYIQPGIESLATSTLKLMKKGVTSFQNIMLLKNCVTYGIDPAWNLLIGFPGEGEEVYKKYIDDIPLLAHLPPPSGVYPVRFDRYSPYFTQAEQYRLDLRPLDFYAFIYPFSQESLASLAYYFSDANAGAEYAQTMIKWIDKIRDKVAAWKARWQNINHDTLPGLFMTRNGNKTVVYDSRFNEVIERQIGEAGEAILKLLFKPKRLEEVSKELSYLTGVDVAKEMAILQDMGLIFHEGDRLLNLAHSSNPFGQNPAPIT